MFVYINYKCGLKCSKISFRNKISFVCSCSNICSFFLGKMCTEKTRCHLVRVRRNASNAMIFPFCHAQCHIVGVKLTVTVKGKLI